MLSGAFLKGREIIEQLEQHYHQAFFVGGCVRDLIIDRPVGDIDIATSATPEDIQQLFKKVIPVGIQHGTVIVRHAHESFEVTTFRLDGDYSDQRHPDSVKFVQTIDQDLKRRDFTINALAMDKDGVVIDLFNGLEDIESKLIRTVGDGFERFTEDPLRIIRALRFSSQLGFTIEQETLHRMKLVKHQIKSLAVERITTEITKLFAGKNINTGITYLKNTDVYKELPIIAEHPSVMSNFPSELNPLYSLGEVIAFLHYTTPEISIMKWSKEWKCSNKTKYEALALYKAIIYFKINGLDNRLVFNLPSRYYNGFLRLTSVLLKTNKININDMKRLEYQLPIQSRRDLALNGDDLCTLFPEKSKGPWISKLLNKMEIEVVDGHIKNNKKELKEWIKWNPPEVD